MGTHRRHQMNLAAALSPRASTFDRSAARYKVDRIHCQTGGAGCFVLAGKRFSMAGKIVTVSTASAVIPLLNVLCSVEKLVFHACRLSESRVLGQNPLMDVRPCCKDAPVCGCRESTAGRKLYRNAAGALYHLPLAEWTPGFPT